MRYIFHLPFSIIHSPSSNLHLEVLSRLDGLEKDVSTIKELLFQTRTEFREEQVRMRAEFREDQAQMRAEFREDLGELRREMHDRFDNMHYQMLVQTRWLIGSLALIGTVVSVLLAIAQFTP
ncbi:MAG: hypothetical protein H8E47_12295 [Anaerolineales bacterium]|nr:hypothetical protein [Anaerolineales bacterium]